MFKSLIILLGLTLLKQSLWSQEFSKDSVIKSIDLKEVQISDGGSDENQSFNFYRTNKLASTEDILSRLQGVNLIRRGALGLEPTLRNYSNGQTNLTIDGMRIYGACTDRMDPVSIYVEPANLKSIQVAHGAAGAIEGSTIGGQIGMHLKEPELNCHKKTNGHIAQSYFTVNNGYSTSASLQQSTKKLAFRLNGTFRNADNYRAGSNAIIQNSGYQKVNTSASLIYKIDTSQIIKLDYLGDWGKNIGFPALPMDVGSATAQIAAITHRYVFENKLLKSNEIKIYYNEITHQMDDTRRADAPMHMDMPGWSKTMGFYNNLVSANNLKIRLDFHRTYTRADMTMYPVNEPLMYLQTLPANSFNDIGLALSRSFYLPKNQQISINARIDYYNQVAEIGPGSKQWSVLNTDITETKINLLKNINLAYSKQINKRSNAQLNLGYGERIPTSGERYGFYLYNRQDQYDYVGNINLKPEQSLQTEFVFKQQFKKLDYSVNIFYHHIKNYIYAYQLVGLSQMTIGAFGLKTYDNINYAISTGFECITKIQMSEEFSYIGSIKYVHAQTYQGLPLPLIPPMKLQHALRYSLKLYQFQVEHDYAMSQTRINPDFGDRITPSFHTLNARVSKNFKFGTSILQLALACENLLNTNYWEHLDIGSVPRFGRNFTINLSLYL